MDLGATGYTERSKGTHHAGRLGCGHRLGGGQRRGRRLANENGHDVDLKEGPGRRLDTCLLYTSRCV